MIRKSQTLYKQAKQIIPGGTQLLSKRPEMFLPNLWPAYYRKAKGCRVWDLDSNEYIDASYMGIGACILGYADRDVNKEVKIAIKRGTMTTLNCPEEVELARLLCDIHPWAQMVRYARSGGEAMAIAVRIARAKAAKDVILFCGYHGWHDWYISANIASRKSLDGHLLPGLKPNGIPRALYNSAIPFMYNDLEQFDRLVRANKGRIAAVVIEPIRNFYPKKGFLEYIRKVTKKENIIMIFDEVSSGWRLNLGGAHLSLKVIPDIAVFAKAMSNGYPMAAIIGKRYVMNAAQDTFISSTYWTERIGPVAALATITKLKTNKIYLDIKRIGETVQKGWQMLAVKHDIKLKVMGTPAINHFSFNSKNKLLLKTLFTQNMLKQGFLATDSFYASFAHKDKYVKAYLKAADNAFCFIGKSIKRNNAKQKLKGAVCHNGFKRLA